MAFDKNGFPRSPPTRVVWIEIDIEKVKAEAKERHHPHGWCGLKSLIVWIPSWIILVTTHTGGVD